jgi:Spy/CpxP family protein refolding chaperone
VAAAVFNGMRAFLRQTGIALAAVLAFAAAAEGGPPFKWWQSEEFRRELNLTTDQISRIEQIFQESLPALKASKRDLDRLDRELSALIADGETSEAQVLRLIDQVEASRSALGRTRSLMLFRMHQVLRPEQRVKLTALHEQRERERRRSGGDSR